MERALPYIIVVKSLESVACRRHLQDNKNITTQYNSDTVARPRGAGQRRNGEFPKQNHRKEVICRVFYVLILRLWTSWSLGLDDPLSQVSATVQRQAGVNPQSQVDGGL